MFLRELGIVTNIVEAAGMGISYAYEDLIFLEHNSFLLQFSDNAHDVLVHINKEADRSTVENDIAELRRVAPEHGMKFVEGTEYVLNQKDEETVTIEFIE